ncbi:MULTISPECIES: DUF4876 domain-containing protein [Chryseobacterium]|uniref:DUF4876 domain-containing protein n=1 Tax=Chryseobacterium camelliae TaxID=1265445 RepID=A0ABU0TKU8_9FLAO|nr:MULTISPECIES: DUF4876 domain-containing protein [Chryseobacterium]MDT3408736.1 hypothetical protein [Pseudacidovorax intermedius]MDQ1097411.1 hypothetical protein [Chryseobacterium camelliae]MDQ1101340.1 hypothetical protein [Chryseobacterium sp. SORGH_AS_1048]MDR6084785.1 hypothetical protein [Chryseobacterium sp. SORGH_AS_0909]MDR6129132.1 hypothetical protein [Chryseobacterium sp. SORGH_AS_1175]
MKKTVLLLSLAVALATGFTVTSCSSDDDFGSSVSQTGVLTMNFTGDQIATYQTLDISIKEINTGTVTQLTIKNTNAHSVELPFGSYIITVNGSVIKTDSEEVNVGASANTDIKINVTNITIPLLVKQFGHDFIIEEVFFTGVRTPDNKNYNSGRYFKITNNTDKVLDAANLIIGQSNFLTTSNDNPTPYDTNTYFPVKGVMILTSTTPKLVEPGDFIVVADNAINHSQNTSTAYNLQNADWEFPSNNPALGQVDNPSVPNAEVIYTQMTYNMFFLHNRGFESYVIARFPAGEDKNTFLQNQKYNYTFVNSAGNTVSRSAYKIPNSWIVDGVNNSIPTDFVQTLTSASIDAGWTSVGSMNNDATRYGKSVRRKVIGQTSKGKNVYKDTNNSTLDFVKDSQPSLKNGITH